MENNENLENTNISETEEFKFTTTLSGKLIKLKHSGFYVERFKSAENKPKILQAAWEVLAKDVHPLCNGKQAKIKYNGLNSLYKKHLDNSMRSGGGRPNWGYWEAFHETAPESVRQSTMPVVREMVGTEQEEAVVRDVVEAPKRTKKGPTFVELQKIYLEKSIELLDNKEKPIGRTEFDEMILQKR